MFKSISVGGRGQASVLVVGHFKGQGLSEASAALDPTGAAAAAAKRPEATGEIGSIAEAFPPAGAKGKPSHTRVIVVGLGDEKKFDPQSFRSVAAAIGRRLVATKDEAFDVGLLTAVEGVKLAGNGTGKAGGKSVDLSTLGQAFGEGLGLLGWVCDEFKGSNTPDPKRRSLRVFSPSAEFDDGVERGLALAESTNFCRTLSQTPPNIATTTYIAEAAKNLAKKTGLKVRIFQGNELERERFTGLINVGKASESPPLMVRLEYVPEGRGGAKGARAGRAAKPLVLIGKTMCYDSGGLSLKVNNGMVGMKRDKDGGCAVLGAMHAIATIIKPRRPVVALLAVAENSISDEAYRPDDVLRYRNGVTVEVTNTDAEGRLVLADALCWACDQENPAAIIDLATLTGGVVTALGSTYCGMFCEDDEFRAQVEKAAGLAGERVWRLPMHDEYRDMMKSPIADILNSNPNRKAHPIQGAAFLSFFVKDNVPWCHLDIAGVHVSEKNAGPYIDGPTGWGVRLLAHLADL